MAEAVSNLVQALNSTFSSERPEWMTNPTDRNLREAGAYDPANGLGKEDEVDPGNMSGSILMLAMLKPEMWADAPNEESRLTVFGNVDYLCTRGRAEPRSGKGIDNRRTNAIEGICNWLQGNPEKWGLRDMTMRTWRLVRIAWCAPDVARGTDPQANPYDHVKQVVNVDDEELPSDHISEQELCNFENVQWNLSDASKERLRSLEAKYYYKSEIGEITGLNKNCKTVGLLQDALYQCFLEGAADHRGDLRFLLFPSWRERQRNQNWCRSQV